METKTYKTINTEEAGWPGGPWSDEPDKMQWQDLETGLPCLVVRHLTSGHLCGYVGVAEGHPFYGSDYDEPDIDIHGGLTYAASCSPEEDESTGICHLPGEGEPDHVWWFGFDCAHCNDCRPYDLNVGFRPPGSTYKTFVYVQNECKRLALQLANLASTT